MAAAFGLHRVPPEALLAPALPVAPARNRTLRDVVRVHGFRIRTFAGSGNTERTLYGLADRGARLIAVSDMCRQRGTVNEITAILLAMAYLREDVYEAGRLSLSVERAVGEYAMQLVAPAGHLAHFIEDASLSRQSRSRCVSSLAKRFYLSHAFVHANLAVIRALPLEVRLAVSPFPYGCEVLLDDLRDVSASVFAVYPCGTE